MPAGDGVGVTPITTAGDGAAIIRTTIGEEEVLTTDITTEIRFTEDPGPDRAAPSRPSRKHGTDGIPPGRHRDLRPVERLVDRHRLVERHRLSPGILRYESYRRHLVRQFLGEQRHLVPSGKRQLVDRQQSRRLYAGRRLIGKLPPRQHDRREQRHLVGKQL